MQRFSRITTATFGAIALIGATSAPAMASPGAKAAVACQGGLQGCVLPVGNAAPAPATAPAPAPAPAPVAEPVVETGGAGWILPALLGIAAIVGAILILDDSDDDDEPISV
ncbi:hypothetical protein [Altererythrobacter sp. MTPC7]|uniref:hypothetical protein n=1 Tax=Altererythrobacter sp. MTPC7 TaxID=3056567 RepID=UPI0036F28C4F